MYLFPRRGATNEYSQHVFHGEEKNININTFWSIKVIYRVLFALLKLRKHAYSNILNILPPKNEIFQIKNSDVFLNSAQNIYCGYSLEPPRRSMFLSRYKKNNVYPWKSQFNYIKVGFNGVKII